MPLSRVAISLDLISSRYEPGLCSETALQRKNKMLVKGAISDEFLVPNRNTRQTVTFSSERHESKLRCLNLNLICFDYLTYFCQIVPSSNYPSYEYVAMGMDQVFLRSRGVIT